MTDTPRSPGRPRLDQTQIDRARIGAAVVEVLTGDGPSALSISRVAKMLGVRSQSLYHHVRGVDDLVDAARSVTIPRIPLDSLRADQPFAAGVEAFAEAYTRAFLPLSGAVWVFFQHPIRDHATISMYERFLERAEVEGIAADRALSLLLDIEYAIFMVVYEHDSLKSILATPALEAAGAVRLQRALDDVSPETWEGSRARLLTLVRRLVRDATERESSAS